MWGLERIAENHGFKANTDLDDDAQVCIYGGCNVPTLSDVQMLCEDISIPRDCIHSSLYGIDVEITLDWYDCESQKEYKETGHEMWKRINQVIPS